MAAGFSHRFDPTSLREYDIRGVVGKTLKPVDGFAIGRTFGSLLARKGGSIVAVGYDGRPIRRSLRRRWSKASRRPAST